MVLALRWQDVHTDEAYGPQGKNLGILARAFLKALRPEGEAILTEARKLAAEQAEDDGLWFVATRAPEQYLQHALRTLHALIEGDK